METHCDCANISELWTDENMIFEKFTVGMRKETEILYRMYGKTIRAIAYQYLKDEDLAEDCLQEVMLRLSTVLDRIGAYGSPEAKGYINAIARNTAIDMRRAHQRAMGNPQNEEPDAEIAKQSVEDQYFIRGDGFSEEIHSYLDKLDALDRQIIYLHYGRHMKYKDIAKVLHRSKTSIEQRASRARKRLELIILEEKAKEEG